MRYPGGIQAGILCISCKSALLPNNELPSSLALPVRSLAVPVTDCPGASGKLLLSLPPPKEGVLYADSKLLQILPSVGFFFPHVRREARPSAEFKGMPVEHLIVENRE